MASTAQGVSTNAPRVHQPRLAANIPLAALRLQSISSSAAPSKGSMKKRSYSSLAGRRRRFQKEEHWGQRRSGSASRLTSRNPTGQRALGRLSGRGGRNEGSLAGRPVAWGGSFRPAFSRQPAGTLSRRGGAFLPSLCRSELTPAGSRPTPFFGLPSAAPQPQKSETFAVAARHKPQPVAMAARAINILLSPTKSDASARAFFTLA